MRSPSPDFGPRSLAPEICCQSVLRSSSRLWPTGLLSADLKARLVFLRWKRALPGHRAFSVYAKKGPRIDFVRLQRALGNKLPADPEAENAAWYRFYLEVQNVPAVQQVHRDFLLLRDYTGLATLFLIGFGLAAFIVVATWKVFTFYLGFLVIQLIVVRHSAATYGIRFVCTVLAQKAGKLRDRVAATGRPSATSSPALRASCRTSPSSDARPPEVGSSVRTDADEFHPASRS
jgi:hypothetical protein